MTTVFKSASIALVFALVSASNAADITESFVRDNCLDCHAGSDAEADFDLESLRRDLSDPSVLDAWTKVLDRVHAGEMPPEDAGEVDPDQTMAFLTATGDWLRDHQQHQNDQRGRVRGRRLTNLQLERTLHDLLAIDIPLARDVRGTSVARFYEHC